MILYLLAPLLIAGIKSQTVNVTVEERRGAAGNQTFGVSTNKNLTSVLSADERIHIQEELENHNQTSTLITEDDEAFQDQDQDQDQDSIHRECNLTMLVYYSQVHCEAHFHSAMVSIGSESWCHLESVFRPYNNFTYCLEELSHLLWCFYPNPETQDIFLAIHSQYFQSCSKEGVVFEDAPQWVVIVLTLIPVSLIPVLVYLVVWKSKVQE